MKMIAKPFGHVTKTYIFKNLNLRGRADRNFATIW